MTEKKQIMKVEPDESVGFLWGADSAWRETDPKQKATRFVGASVFVKLKEKVCRDSLDCGCRSPWVSLVYSTSS